MIQMGFASNLINKGKRGEGYVDETGLAMSCYLLRVGGGFIGLF